MLFCRRNGILHETSTSMSLKNSNVFIIGISGGSGSGKTSFIQDIKTHFTSEEICFLSQDDYYRPREEQKSDENGIKNFDLPESIDIDEYFFDLVRLTNGIEVERNEYTYNNNLKEPTVIRFKPAPIIIVEGLFVFNEPKLYDIMDLRIIIHATDTQKIIRRIKRDRVERNYPLEDVLYRYEHHVLPSFEAFISPFLNKVDLIINNNKSYVMGRDMLVSFLKEKLQVAKSV